MHDVYAEVLERRYKSLAEGTRKIATCVFNSLPPPEELSPESVEEVLADLAAGSRITYMTHIKKVEEALGLDLLSSLHKPKVQMVTVRPEDLYTRTELEKIWAGCTETRDRAIYQVLYESGLRRFELTGLDFEHVRVTKNLWWLNITGKGKKSRTVPILHSVPALQEWMNVHKLGSGPLFVLLRAPWNRLKGHSLYDRTTLILEQVGVRIRPRPVHLFRHTRATELAGMGMTEAELCQFFGWEIGSRMPRVYVHLSGRDLKRSMTRIYGLPVEKEDGPALKIESQECPRCKKINPPLARFCSQCSFVLDERLALQMQPEPLPSDDETLERIIDERVRILLGQQDSEE